MIIIDIIEWNDLAWYAYLLAGFSLGAYFHCHLLRHWLHLLVITLLKGIIWLLQRADYYYKEPKVTKPKRQKASPPITPYGQLKDGIEVDPDNLEEWLRNNPELSVQKR